MAFGDHKVAKFEQTISDLPDQPNLTPQDLKARFDHAPERLRQALAAVCDEGDALAARMDGYRAQTFPGEITAEMLAAPVRQDIADKAEAAALAAETAAREALGQQLAQKCEVFFGTYTGDGAAEQTIPLGFAPKGVLVFNQIGQTGWYDSGFRAYSGGLAFVGHPSKGIAVTGNGFTITGTGSSRVACINTSGEVYYYVAFR